MKIGTRKPTSSSRIIAMHGERYPHWVTTMGINDEVCLVRRRG
jgi:hypothetical protein